MFPVFLFFFFFLFSSFLFHVLLDRANTTNEKRPRSHCKRALNGASNLRTRGNVQFFLTPLRASYAARRGSLLDIKGEKRGKRAPAARKTFAGRKCRSLTTPAPRLDLNREEATRPNTSLKRTSNDAENVRCIPHAEKPRHSKPLNSALAIFLVHCY